MTPRIERSGDAISVVARRYRLELDPRRPLGTFTEPDGAAPMRLFLLAALDTDRGLDGTLSHGAARIEEDGDSCTLSFQQASTVWDRKTVLLRCCDDELTFQVSVEGSARLTDMRLLGGWYTGDDRWGGGRFHSQWTARTLFDPAPDDPARVVSPAIEPATIGVTGGALPGRGHWFFTPAPFLFAGTPAVTDDPAATGGQTWQTLELRAGATTSTFSELRYAPFLGGFSLELAYEGETAVDGTFTSPPLVVRTGVRDPYRALEEHAAALRATGAAPTVRRERPGWWTRPIFCGWGEQCRVGRLESVHPTSLSRRDRYDAWLGILAGHGVRPGTVVIDDRWQKTYGRNEVDADRWPDLRGWIADRHARDQRVLLWFKAWDPEGLPAEACVTDELGRPVAADPTSPAYEAILREALTEMLGHDGLDADGLKVDFTAQTPSGPGLRRAGSEWGVALLHRLLELVYRSAKAVKPDALVVTHAASPLFADVTDMVRLNDLMRLDDPEPRVPAVPQMRHRARVASSIEPGMLIDTDDWCMPSKAEWRAYLEAKPELGVPALYYATGIDYSGEAFDADDYAAIRTAWDRWEEQR